MMHSQEVMGKRRVFSREFKHEAARLVLERGVKVSRASKDLGNHENVQRKWIRDVQADPQQSFPGRGKIKPDDPSEGSTLQVDRTQLLRLVRRAVCARRVDPSVPPPAL